MRQHWKLIAITLLAAAIGLPWLAAYRGDRGMHYLYGGFEPPRYECEVVDGTHFDRYFCLVYEEAQTKRVRSSQGRILLDGQPVRFPPGQNAGFLRSDGQIQFAKLTAPDVTRTSAGESEIYYILGKVPHFKRFPEGVPSVAFIERTWGVLSYDGPPE